MKEHGAFCNGKAKTGTADFPGMGLVYSIEAFIDMSQLALRDANAGIAYLEGKNTGDLHLKIP